MAKEFWRWKEYNWHSPDIDWKQAESVTAGVDVGSVSSQTVIMTDGQLFAYSKGRSDRTGIPIRPASCQSGFWFSRMALFSRSYNQL